jgi:Holliday junction resolvase
MLKNPKSKGNRHERHVAELLRGYGFDAKRTPMSGAIDWMKGDITSRDFPFFIEAKNTEKTKFLEWYKKAEDQSGAMPPIIVWTSNNENIYCFLLFTDMLSLMTGGAMIKEKIKKP